MATEHLRFGVFLPPYHKFGISPNLAVHRDLEFVQLWERLGFDEVWVGEHHSGGTELISSPELFLAAAAVQTSRIRLGTGVVSVPYHHPFMVAERIVLLDQLSRGRAMLGVGPGALPFDAAMLGIEQSDTRPRLEEGLTAILRLLAGDEPVTMKTDWFTLDRAELQIAPCSRPRLEVAVAAAVSPSGARLAGKFGCGLLCVAATSPAGFEALRSQWEVAQEQAVLAGTVVERDRWRVVGPMHLAETREQACRDVEYGLEDWARYFQQVGAVPQVKIEGRTTRDLIDEINDGGLGVIGTPTDAIAQVARLQEQTEGFGCYMLIGHDWADPRATEWSYELFARWVMPEFQGAMDGLRRSIEHSMERYGTLSAAQEDAIAAAKARYAAERNSIS